MKKGLFLSVLSIVTFACVVIGIGIHVILPRITKDSNKKNSTAKVIETIDSIKDYDGATLTEDAKELIKNSSVGGDGIDVDLDDVDVKLNFVDGIKVKAGDTDVNLNAVDGIKVETGDTNVNVNAVDGIKVETGGTDVNVNAVDGIKVDTGNNSKTSETISYDSAEEKITALDMDIKTGAVRIVSDNSAVGIEISYKGEEELQPTIKYENGKLKIKQKNKNDQFNLGINAVISEIEVRINPDIMLEEADLNLNAGDLNIKDLKCEDFDLTLNAGNFVIRDSVFNDSSIKMDAGNIDVKNCDLGSASIECNAGSIGVDDTAFTSLDAESNMGNVDIDCMEDKDSYSISAKTDLGEIRVDGHKEGRNYKNAVEDGIPIKAKTNMGNVEIDF